VAGFDPACAAPVEEEGLGDNVRGVQRGDAEGNDVVEGGGGTDVDEADHAGGDGGDDDGVNRDGTADLDL